MENSSGNSLKEIGEFGFIRMIQKDCHFGPQKFTQGIGDDCAVIGPIEGKVLLITTDLLVENIHFLLGRIQPENLGVKAVAVNISDIAAMGGTPLHIFVSVACPSSFPLETLTSIFKGIKYACRDFKVNLLGGDTSSSPSALFLNITAVGEMAQDQVLYRKGAKPGDFIYVTGTLGDSAAGLAIIKGEIDVPAEIRDALIKAHNLPVPQVQEGRLIAESGLASAMIDISDGLVSDLGHICESSGVGAVIYENQIPISSELKMLSNYAGIDPLQMALSGGEDYMLLVTVPKENILEIEKQFEDKNWKIFQIGRIIGEKSLKCIGLDGREKFLNANGFDHFR